MQFDVSSLRIFSRFILGLSMLNVNGEQQWLCIEKADFRTLELLSKENIFVCLFCLPGPPSPSLLISDSAVQRPLSWPRKCHLSTDQTCCTCNVHTERGVYKFSTESVSPWVHLSPAQKGDRRPGSCGQNQFCSGGQNLPPECGPVWPAASHAVQEDHNLVISPTQRGGCSQKMTPC